MKYQGLEPKKKPSRTATSLKAGIRNADTGEPEQITTWTVCGSVLVAALQRRKGVDGQPMIRLKGGAYLEWSMHPNSRSTQDIDTFYTETADELHAFLSESLAEALGSFTFNVKPGDREIQVDLAAVNPRQFEVQVFFANSLLRKIKLEVSFAEGSVATVVGSVPAPRLEPFGVETPIDQLVSIAPEYQIAQKLHACTGPGRATRERDVLDIHLLKQNVFDQVRGTGGLHDACKDVFENRAKTAAAVGVVAASWPVEVKRHLDWGGDYGALAHDLGIAVTLDGAISEINAWITEFAC